MNNRQVEGPPDKDNDSTSVDVSKMLEQEKEILQYKLLLEKRRKMLMVNRCEKEKPLNVKDFMNSIKRKPDSPNKEKLKDMASRDAEKYMQVVRLFRDMGDAKAVKEKLLNEKTEKGSNKEFPGQVEGPPDKDNDSTSVDVSKASRDAEKYMQVVRLFRDMGDAKAVKEKLLNEKTEKGKGIYLGDAKAVKEKLLNEKTENGSNKEFPELTHEMKAAIIALLHNEIGNDSDQITKYDDIPLLRHDMRTLNHEGLLNDGIINCYLKLLMERSKLDKYPSMYCYNSFFFESLSMNPTSKSIKNWSKNEDIFSYDLLCFPINELKVHWVLCVVDNRDKTVKLYDSMSGSRHEHVTVPIRNYLIAEMWNKKKMTMPTDEYTCLCVKNLPQQQNNTDCGMFTLKYAEYISRDAPLTFHQEHIPYFRWRMVWELKEHKLL